MYTVDGICHLTEIHYSNSELLTVKFVWNRCNSRFATIEFNCKSLTAICVNLMKWDLPGSRSNPFVVNNNTDRVRMSSVAVFSSIRCVAERLATSGELADVRPVAGVRP